MRLQGTDPSRSGSDGGGASCPIIEPQSSASEPSPVGLAEARIDVNVIQPDVPFRRAERNRAKARIAPPGSRRSPSWSKGRPSLRATPAVETSATVHSRSGFASGVKGTTPGSYRPAQAFITILIAKSGKR